MKCASSHAAIRTPTSSCFFTRNSRKYPLANLGNVRRWKRRRGEKERRREGEKERRREGEKERRREGEKKRKGEINEAGKLKEPRRKKGGKVKNIPKNL
jgi:hypothetical protein